VWSSPRGAFELHSAAWAQRLGTDRDGLSCRSAERSSLIVNALIVLGRGAGVVRRITSKGTIKAGEACPERRAPSCGRLTLRLCVLDAGGQVFASCRAEAARNLYERFCSLSAPLKITLGPLCRSPAAPRTTLHDGRDSFAASTTPSTSMAARRGIAVTC
jgi:hypothetical protein